MGIRPEFSIIIGVTGLKKDDKRLKITSDIDPYEICLPEKFDDGSVCFRGYDGKTLGDVLYNPFIHNEFVVDGIVGYILAQESGSNLMYGFYESFPEIFQVNGGYGFREFKTRELRYHEKRILETRKSGDGRDRVEDIEFCVKYGFLYDFTPCGESAMDAREAKKVLEMFGWNFDYSDLKKLLVWNWS